MALGYVVRTVVTFEESQKLDYLGFLFLLDKAGLIHLHRNDKDGACFDFLPPVDVQVDDESKEWADEQVQRLVAHGFNAVRAPRMPR